MKKPKEVGTQSGKTPAIGGDLYDTCGSKNQGFHNGRNFGGHFLIEHPVKLLIQHSKCRANDRRVDKKQEKNSK